MPRFAHSYMDYRKLGDSKGLDYIEPEGYTPRNSRTPVKWRCRLTGHTFTKAYQRVKDAEFGTRYQRDFAKNLSRYNRLAEILKIKFLYNFETDKFPKNTKTRTLWEGRAGNQVMASFHELAYDIIPDRLMLQLGISKEELQGLTIRESLEGQNV